MAYPVAKPAKGHNYYRVLYSMNQPIEDRYESSDRNQFSLSSVRILISGSSVHKVCDKIGFHDQYHVEAQGLQGRIGLLWDSDEITHNQIKEYLPFVLTLRYLVEDLEKRNKNVSYNLFRKKQKTRARLDSVVRGSGETHHALMGWALQHDKPKFLVGHFDEILSALSTEEL
ncbi:hypothetical protein Cgig2_016375 [Carnegiea gigantea]|uniref:Uncharacterized protein n=1 Tax=Carnegiea gigantea TaxID=171969 RepID=A0A9Q1Q7R1_9CARY|nr:hypothetical protein Cgig2_016375 [Carnegiea gigantea]